MDGMDFIDQAQANPVPMRGKKKFVSPTERLPDEVISAAGKPDQTRRGLAPGYKRHTVVVHDEWVAMVERMADELSITKMDAWSYLLRLGVRDYLAGEKPDLKPRPRALNQVVEESH